jgi:competence protein ComEC
MAWAVPAAVGLAFAVGGVALRRWTLVVLGAFLLASASSSAAWRGVAPPPVTPVAEVVTLLSDPTPLGSGERLTARLGQKHVEVVAHGAAGRKLARRLAGERVWLQGTLKPVAGQAGQRLARRHIVGRIEATTVGDDYDGAPVYRSANQVRRVIERGAQVMSPAERALFSGFVLGDDRAEPKEVVDEFRATGLAHLTAVSGENVAFVLVAAGPLLRRLTVRWRWTATVGLVVWFAMLTRFEPSVLRASAMAVVSVTAWAMARPSSVVRMLCLAATVMLLLDPFLVWSAGWWLSVGATFGIALFSVPIARRLPGPRWLAEAVGVTAAAQTGVAPVQLAIFGGLPLVSIPANLLAVPAAGPVMIWGLPAGLIAGVSPRPVAWVLHLPSRICIRWIALVARLAARIPLGVLETRQFLALLLAVAVAWLWRRRLVGRLAAACLALAVVASAGMVARAPQSDGVLRISDAVRVWRVGGDTVVAVDGLAPRLLDDLRAHSITHVTALVATSRAADIDAAARLLQPLVILRSDTAAGSYPAGRLTIEVTSFVDTIDVDVGRSSGPAVAPAK